MAFRGVLNRPEGATITGGDGALNLALHLPDANPSSDPIYAHCSWCREEKKVLENVRMLIFRNKPLQVGICLK